MPVEKESVSLRDLNKQHRIKLLNLNNKILRIRLEYLSALKEHYNDYWLNFDIRCSAADLECQSSKKKYFAAMALKTEGAKIDELAEKIGEKMRLLSEEETALGSRLRRYERLNQDLLAEYWVLKEDLECQEMLIKISERNTE